MRSAGNFHPEWGYLAPRLHFRRTLRVAVVAAAIGALAGAVVGTSLLSPSRANNRSGPVYALISATSAIALPAETVTNGTVAARDTASPPLASLSSDTGESIEIAPATAAAMRLPTAAANLEPDAAGARKRPIRQHRARLASNALKYARHERALTHPDQLPRHSRFVQLDRFCCSWTTPPRAHNALGW